MTTAIDPSEFTQAVDETPVVVPCMSFVVFLELTDDAGILDFYTRSREALGDRLTHYQAETMSRFAKLNARGDAMVPTWFTHPRKGKDSYQMFMAEGDPSSLTTASALELSVFREPASEWTGRKKEKTLAMHQAAHTEGRTIAPRVASQLRVTLPLDHPLADPERFREWVLGFRLLHGEVPFTAYGGYAINAFNQPTRSVHEPAQKLLAATVLRHPGFDWDGGGPQARICEFFPGPARFLLRIKRINWLNLVCDRTLEHIGGRKKVVATLESDPDIAVKALEHGLLIQAGPKPQVGDLAAHDFTPVYRTVARALRGLRIRELGEVDGLGEQTNQWLNELDTDRS